MNGLPQQDGSASREIINYQDYVLQRGEQVKYLLLGAFILFSIGFIFFNNLLIALVFSGGAIFYPKIRREQLKQKRQVELNLQFKDLLYSLSSSLSVGRSLEGAFINALGDLRVLYAESDAYIVQEVELICRRLTINQPVELALMDFAYRSGLEDVKNFADVLIICKRTGGNLVQVVKNTTVLINEKIDIHQEIQLVLTKHKYEQKVLNYMPFLFIALIKFGGSGYMDCLYASPLGYGLMAVALVIIGLSYVISQKIFEIKV